MYKIFYLALTVLLAVKCELTLSEMVSEEPLTAVKETNVTDKNKYAEYYRLPKGVIPLTYKLRMIPFLDGNFTFKGDVTMKLLINSSTRNITLHSKGLNISELRIFEFGPPKVEIPLENFRHDKGRDFLIVNSKMYLNARQTYALYVQFEGELNDDSDGFYKSSYVDSAGKLLWLATTQFEPQSARTAFPCFDEPHLKANFSVSVGRPRGMNTLSNMGKKGPPKADPNLPENYVWDHFQETPKMSTYLVAFVVSNFTSGKAKDREFRVWTREEHIHDAEYSLKIGPKFLDIMHAFNFTEYSLPKMDMIAIPDFNARAMENWGLVTYRESVLLFNSNMSSTAYKQETALVVAHEMAHQWFGDLVSPEWWTWIWLSEGFATYFAKVAVDKFEPSWRMMELFVVEELQTALLSDSKSTHPMNISIKTPMDIMKGFDDISYNKAGSVIRMMINLLAKNTFLRGLGNYFIRRKFNSAKDEDLFQAMDDQALIDQTFPDRYTISEIMKPWTTQAGYPVVTVKRDFVSGRVEVKQERFTLYPANDNKTETWWIPITYTRRNSRNFKHTGPLYWMKERTYSIPLEDSPAEDEWIIFNLQQSGFYRVNYDEHNWRLLSDYLRSKNYHNIPPVHRAQLIDDALNLARGGYLNYSIALTLTSYLEHESDYIPLYSAYQAFSFLETQLSESNVLYHFKVHMRKIMKSYSNNQSFGESPEDDHLTKLSRSTLMPWVCKYHYVNCVSRASKLFQDWKENREQSIPAELRSVAYCFGVREGGNEEWNYLWKAYHSSSVATEKELMLKSLGCSINKTKIHGFLEMAMDTTSGIRKHDIVSVFASVCNSREGLDTTVTFLINKFDAMLSRLGAGIVGKIIKTASSRVSSKGQADKMRAFLNKIDNGPLKDNAQKAIKSISSNLVWIKNYGPEIESWLKKTYSAHHSDQQFSLLWL